MTNRDLRKIIYISAGVLVIAAAIITVTVVKNQPQPPLVWYVEEGYEDGWAKIAAANGFPDSGEIKAWRLGIKPENKEYGFIITTTLDDQVEITSNGIRVFRQLSRNMAVGDAMLLAVDPWLVYRDQDDPPLTRTRITSTDGGEGTLYIPGKESDMVKAWLAQFVVKASGIFPDDPQAWSEAETALFEGRRFQQGAITFSWNDVWFYFTRRKPSWIYGPISKIRNLPGQDTDRLTATRFPSLINADEFGIQANLLWAIPFGDEKALSNLEPASVWLHSAEAQTLIANTLGWIPAHRDGKPFNILVYNAQMAWFTSSYVWQIASP